MNFTPSFYEREMKRPPCAKMPERTETPKGSRCFRCPYWRGIVCASCYRDILKRYHAGR